jgi:uncharacterized protein
MLPGEATSPRRGDTHEGCGKMRVCILQSEPGLARRRHTPDCHLPLRTGTMSELQPVVGQLYGLAKSGHWDRLLSEWADSAVLASRCSRYTKPGSSWTFLHQAAYFGNEQACRILISRGASVVALTSDARSPADVAEQKRHHALAALLRNASAGIDPLWLPPVDPDVLPSCNRWNEATETMAHAVMFVAYAGGLVRIPRGTRYFVDSLGRVLVGWHGTFNPPLGMDGQSMVSREP